MRDPMADDFLSFMVFIFKALFLKTLKFQLFRYFSLRPHDESSWDEEQIVHNLCRYGPNSYDFKIFMFKYFSMLKTLKIPKMEKNIVKKSVFFMKKILTHKNFKIATLRPITTSIMNNLLSIP